VKSGVHACLSRRRSRVRIPSSPLIGQIAQSVEHLSEKQGVGSSILPLATKINFMESLTSIIVDFYNEENLLKEYVLDLVKVDFHKEIILVSDGFKYMFTIFKYR
jgi:hypothetical protein